MAARRESPTLASSFPLQHRVAIVTGASRGIGRAISLHLASLGARTVVNYTASAALADSLAAEINSSHDDNDGPRAVVCQADVSDPNQVRSLFETAERAFGSAASILVNSAGVMDSKYPAIANTSVEDFDKIFSINARGTFLCCKEAANRLKRGSGGRIILLSSSLVGVLKPGSGAYTASKAAVETLTRILAKELKGTGITVNCVAPGATATDMFLTGRSQEYIARVIEECPLGRLGEPGDVASLVGFLATDAGEWINGQVIRVNGGFV